MDTVSGLVLCSTCGTFFLNCSSVYFVEFFSNISWFANYAFDRTDLFKLTDLKSIYVHLQDKQITVIWPNLCLITSYCQIQSYLTLMTSLVLYCIIWLFHMVFGINIKFLFVFCLSSLGLGYTLNFQTIFHFLLPKSLWLFFSTGKMRVWRVFH